MNYREIILHLRADPGGAQGPNFYRRGPRGGGGKGRGPDPYLVLALIIIRYKDFDCERYEDI